MIKRNFLIAHQIKIFHRPIKLHHFLFFAFSQHKNPTNKSKETDRGRSTKILVGQRLRQEDQKTSWQGSELTQEEHFNQEFRL